VLLWGTPPAAIWGEGWFRRFMASTWKPTRMIVKKFEWALTLFEEAVVEDGYRVHHKDD
jgi:hypothetical protein